MVCRANHETFNRICCGGLLFIILALLARRANQVGMLIERPYEEAVYRVALRQEVPIMSRGTETWTEHPPLCYDVLRVISFIIGRDIGRLRFIWLIFFLSAFCLLLAYVWQGNGNGVVVGGPRGMLV